MAMSLSELQKALKQPTYTPLTEEQMQAQAQTRFASQYDAQRMAARQGYETTDLALQQQRAGLETGYARQAEQAQKQIMQALSSADKYSLQRGMQRSSYNAANLTNINDQGNRALNDIAAALTQSQGNIDAQRTQLAQQLAQALAQYDTSQANDTQAYIDTLRQQEYERGQAADQYANQLLMALYEYGKGSSGGGGSYSSKSTSGTASAASAATQPTTASNLQSIMAALGTYTAPAAVKGATTGALLPKATLKKQGTTVKRVTDKLYATTK